MRRKLGIIAGGGDLPRRVINACISSGRPYFVVCIKGHALIESVRNAHHIWLDIGKLGSSISILKNEGVSNV